VIQMRSGRLTGAEGFAGTPDEVIDLVLARDERMSHGGIEGMVLK
jgi:hypothetical protein